MEDILKLEQQIFSTKDRTQKLIYTLFRKSGAVTVEVGAIDKQDGKLILCVPTQTNCAQACRFCHTTGLAGKVVVNNLTALEIETIVRDAWRDCGFAAHYLPLLVSFMGLGEPMANQAELVRAMVALDNWAFLVRLPIRYAFSTMLPHQHLADFAQFMVAVEARKLKVKMHLSLHYTIDEQRKEWMPTASSISVSLSLLNEYHRRTGNAVEIHYTLIGGLNDSTGDMFRLICFLSDAKTPIKFLHYNPVPGDERRAPCGNWTDFFRAELEKYGIPTEWYDSPGADIAASCGMFLTDQYITTQKVELVLVDETRTSSPLIGYALNSPEEGELLQVRATF